MYPTALYVAERVEELRSRISLVESTLKTIDQDIWSAFSTAMGKGLCPPILYPASTFNKLTLFKDRIKTSLRGINPTAHLPFLLQKLDDLDIDSMDLLTEIVRLQNVLSQRTAGTGIEKTMEYKATAQSEFCLLSKSYDAVDALTYELVNRVLGSEWVRREKYFPISLFDYRGYMINLHSYIISVPYHDSFRSRFWPSLAHEVGHIFVSYHTTLLRGAIFEVVLRNIDILKTILGFRLGEVAGDNPAINQLVELVSDAVSAYVCPTAFLSAASLIGIPFESVDATNGALARFFKTTGHPPLDSRLALMNNVLRITDGLSQNRTFREQTESVMVFMEQKNLFGLTPVSYDFIEKYNDFANGFSREIVRVLPRLGVIKFGENEWSAVRDAFVKQDYAPLSPVQLLMVAWLKRLITVKNENILSLQEYLDIRLNEEKAFETVVDLMHKYYEKEIIGKMELNWRDIRNRTS
jgi:hypothetical protein